ncbi:hypothetical protein EDD17DRAFT_1540678, partial [Pisolithus thermaeus]
MLIRPYWPPQHGRKLLFIDIYCLPVRLREIYDHEHADLQGIDVSDYQTDIDWTTVVDNGISFVYIKATEGTSTDAGLIRGGYYFAHPDESDGATQALISLDNLPA